MIHFVKFANVREFYEIYQNLIKFMIGDKMRLKKQHVSNIGQF